MSDNEVLNAIRDLTRVTIALQGGLSNRSEAIRKLHALSIPPSRIAAILAVDINHVTGVIAKARKGSEEATTKKKKVGKKKKES